MVYGASSKHPRGQRVGLDHILMDEGEYRREKARQTAADHCVVRRRHPVQALMGKGILCKCMEMERACKLPLYNNAASLLSLCCSLSQVGVLCAVRLAAL